MICLLQLRFSQSAHQVIRKSQTERIDYYLLGKNLPCSGNLVLISRSALTLHVKVQMPAMTAAMMAVLAFQLAGCAYQPPDGDQTCLGYLSNGRGGSVEGAGEASGAVSCRRKNLRDLASAALFKAPG